MVLVKVTNPETNETKEFYMNEWLRNQLDSKVIPALNKKDEDYVLIVDGGERKGKSVFSQQIGGYVDPTLCLNRICFNANEFREAIIKANKGQCIIYDEAFRGLSSKGTLSEVNKILVSLMMEMGQKNLFIIINLPTYFLLEKYVALWRARGLFHVYSHRGRKGFWKFFNKEKKQRLYLLGKKEYNYQKVRSKITGRFTNFYFTDEDEYRKKKDTSLKQGFKTSNGYIDKNTVERDILIKELYKSKGIGIRKLHELLKQSGLDIGRGKLEGILRVKERDVPKTDPSQRPII